MLLFLLVRLVLLKDTLISTHISNYRRAMSRHKEKLEIYFDNTAY